MNNQPQNPTTPKPTNVETLALLARIAAATEANTEALANLADLSHRLIEISIISNEAATGTAETLAKVITAVTTAPAAALTAAPASPAAVHPGNYVDFLAEALLYSIGDDGKAVFKIRGGQYNKFGIRVWPETLPALGIDPDTLKPGRNEFVKMVRALLGENGPRKIIGLAE